MRTTIECEKCEAIYVVKFKSHIKKNVSCKCPFCGNTEELTVGRD